MTHPPTSVLVIDNEKAICMSLAAYLEDFGFDVGMAASAEAALQKITQRRYDVAIVDLRLPEMSGETWILEANKIRPGMRFIIHTGSVSYSIPEELKQLGVNPEDVMSKPQPDLSTFVTSIERLVQGTG